MTLIDCKGSRLRGALLPSHQQPPAARSPAPSLPPRWCRWHHGGSATLFPTSPTEPMCSCPSAATQERMLLVLVPRPSQNISRKERNKAQKRGVHRGAQSSPQPPGSRFLPGRSLFGGTMLRVRAALYQPRPCRLGRKRVSIRAERCFRRQTVPRAGPDPSRLCVCACVRPVLHPCRGPLLLRGARCLPCSTVN